MIAALALALAGCGKGTGVPKTVATVDGKSISGTDYVELLNTKFSKQALAALVEQRVLIDWAEKEKVPVTDAQIDKQVEILKRDGAYDVQVRNYGSEQALRDSYRDTQARINLGEKLYKFTDGELMTLYSIPGMKRRYVHGPRKEVVGVVSANAKRIKDAEKAIADGMEFEAAAMKYSDPMFVMAGPPMTFVEKGVGSETIQKAVEKLKVGEVSKPFSFAAGQYGSLHGILKVTAEQPKLNLKFPQVKGELKGLAALQKAAIEPDFQKKLDERKKKADVVIELPQCKYLVDQIKNPPPPMGYQMMAPNVRPGPAPKAAAK